MLLHVDGMIVGYQTVTHGETAASKQASDDRTTALPASWTAQQTTVHVHVFQP